MSTSEETVSTIEHVYVRLLGEGTIVYRPVVGLTKGTGVVLLIEPQGYDPNDEDCGFKPGTTVRLKRRTVGGRRLLVAVLQMGPELHLELYLIVKLLRGERARRKLFAEA